jgi:NAD(P)-dependent dehydrogenase (short-subunit alcohol dehydrogenase family)
MSEWTAADLPSQAGRTIIITGANSGLGEATARALAHAGANVVMAVRDTRKGETAAQKMAGSIVVRRLDLQDLSSIQEFADGVDRADVLINNAGIMAVPYRLTRDGFESQFGTNHLGHFALTNLLLRKLSDRVVTVTSLVHWRGNIDLNDLNWRARRYSAYLAYSQSKLANLLFTSELQRQLTGVGSSVRSLAAHPGYSKTHLLDTSGRNLGNVLKSATTAFATSAEFGARQTLFAAVADLPGDTLVGPRFGMFGRTQAVGRSGAARDASMAARLWDLSEHFTSTKFPL